MRPVRGGPSRLINDLMHAVALGAGLVGGGMGVDRRVRQMDIAHADTVVGRILASSRQNDSVRYSPQPLSITAEREQSLNCRVVTNRGCYVPAA